MLQRRGQRQAAQQLLQPFPARDLLVEQGQGGLGGLDRVGFGQKLARDEGTALPGLGDVVAVARQQRGDVQPGHGHGFFEERDVEQGMVGQAVEAGFLNLAHLLQLPRQVFSAALEMIALVFESRDALPLFLQRGLQGGDLHLQPDPGLLGLGHPLGEAVAEPRDGRLADPASGRRHLQQRLPPAGQRRDRHGRPLLDRAPDGLGLRVQSLGRHQVEDGRRRGIRRSHVGRAARVRPSVGARNARTCVQAFRRNQVQGDGPPVPGAPAIAAHKIDDFPAQDLECRLDRFGRFPAICPRRLDLALQGRQRRRLGLATRPEKAAVPAVPGGAVVERAAGEILALAEPRLLAKKLACSLGGTLHILCPRAHRGRQHRAERGDPHR